MPLLSHLQHDACRKQEKLNRYLVNKREILSRTLATNGVRKIEQELPEVADLRGGVGGCICACLWRVSTEGGAEAGEAGLGAQLEGSASHVKEQERLGAVRCWKG